MHSFPNHVRARRCLLLLIVVGVATARAHLQTLHDSGFAALQTMRKVGRIRAFGAGEGGGMHA